MRPTARRTESKEVIGGFSILNVESNEEALEQARTITALHPESIDVVLSPLGRASGPLTRLSMRAMISSGRASARDSPTSSAGARHGVSYRPFLGADPLSLVEQTD